MTDDHPNLRFMPLDDVTKASGAVDIIRDAWWAVHPERGLVFWRHSPQCNTDKRVADQVVPMLYPWADIQQIVLVMIPEGFGR